MMYNDIVSKLRTIARDQLRMEGISNWRDQLFSLNDRKNNFEKCITDNEKSIAIAEYKISKLEDANPEKEDLVKTYTDSIEQSKKAIEGDKKVLEDTAKEIAEANEKIAKWESGETKVDADRMEIIAMDLIKLVTNEATRLLAVELPTPKTEKKVK